MKFTLTIETDNAALMGEEGVDLEELAGILRHLADRVAYGTADGDRGAVLDINGNAVGRWELEA